MSVAEVEGRGIGTLQIVGNAQQVVPHQLDGETCAVAAKALALAIALAIDPQAASDANAQPEGTRVRTRTATTLTPAPTTPTKPAPHKPAVAARVWTRSVGLEGVSILGFAAEPAFGLVAALRIEPPGNWDVWPDFRVALTAATTSGTWESKSGVGATWRWLYARSEACPLRLLESGPGRAHLGLCAALDLGIVASRGEALVNSQTEYRIWISPGTELRFEWWLTDLLALEMAVGAAFAPQRYKYTYQSGPLTGDPKVIFTVHRFGPTFSVGTAFRLP